MWDGKLTLNAGFWWRVDCWWNYPFILILHFFSSTTFYNFFIFLLKTVSFDRFPTWLGLRPRSLLHVPFMYPAASGQRSCHPSWRRGLWDLPRRSAPFYWSSMLSIECTLSLFIDIDHWMKSLNDSVFLSIGRPRRNWTCPEYWWWYCPCVRSEKHPSRWDGWVFIWS